MSKRNIKNDIPLLERKKIKVDLITFMYGTLLVRLTKDIKDINELNTKIELIGYDIGKRLVDDLIDDFQRVDTSDQNKLMEKLICQLAQYYLGIIGNYPLEEWRVTRDIVASIAEKLKEEGIDAYIVTPETDLDVALSIRARRANEYIKCTGKKGLFISVHVDAHGDGSKWMSGNGWSCWTTRGQNNSDKFADCLYDAAEEILIPLGRKIRTDKTDGDRDWESDFTVIYKAAMPAVLTENLFQTHIEDCKFLSSEEGKEAIVKLHIEGIKKYIEKYG